MNDKYLRNSLGQSLEDETEHRPMDAREVEIRLAIADYVIQRVAGTPAGKEIFEGLIKRYENRYPHHKLLAHLLTNPGHFEMDADDLTD